MTKIKNMQSKFLLGLGTALILHSTNVNSQGLPVGFTNEELIKMGRGEFTINQGRGITTAPTGNLRTMAEWEEIQTLLVTYGDGSGGYYPSIVRQIIDLTQDECEVLVACTDSNAVKTYLTSGGVPLTNVKYLEVASNSIWVRDYGGHTVYKNDVDSLLMVEWIYNRPTRPDDDAMPNSHAAWKGVPLYSTTSAPNDLVNTGGNWMVDGFGTALVSKVILDENDAGNPYGVTVKSEAQIDGIMNDFMGINRYIKMDVLPYDLIHHVDMHIKFINEETLLVGEYPAGVADGPQIEANLAYVTSTFMSKWGTPFKVIRIPQPPSTSGLYPDGGASYRTYANWTFVNKTIICPSYRVEYDTTAMRILTQALPGYNIQFIDCDNTGANIISASGAIHCITNCIGVDDPLLISHQELADTYDDINPYIINAFVKHKTGITAATLYYSLDGGGTFTSVVMTPTGGDNYTASIPAQIIGTHILYYIKGDAVNGKMQVRPIVAPTGNFDFWVLPPISVPEIDETVSINVFPNPAGAITCIDLNGNVEGNVTVTLQNILSQQVQTLFSGKVENSNKKLFFNAANYEAGTYLLKVATEKWISVTKVIVR